MDKLPFSVYDFFGYLSAGFLVMVGVVAAFVGEDTLNQNPSLIVGILLIVTAYIIGQVVANIAGFFLESLVVGRLLGRPTLHLFGEQESRWALLFPGYFRPLPLKTQERVLKRAREEADIDEPGGALFFHCHAVVKREPVTVERLGTFLNLYGFCRNTSMALISVVAFLAVGIHCGSAETGVVSPGWWLIGAAVAAVALFYRYLKFFRHYAQEVFTSYAGLS
jgi:hypothetical protein